MSNVVDSKVVELSLENKSFETNANTSISTLNKLEKALNLKGGGKGFDDINSSIKKVNVATLTSGINNLQVSLSNLGRVAVFSMLADEAIKAKNAVESFIKSVTLDQVNAGFSKYADKTSAVQTIMAATAKDWEDQGAQMEYVNGQLEKLNWFTDETSYNFLDMVNNIGKFTSNNISLEKSVTAMEGISTWAAISGGNVQAAGHAMYNLAQAISTGSVKLMDWKSIELANMATAQFKETVIDTAVSVGTLTKEADGTFKTLKGHAVSVENFNENLSDAWFTSEVLLDTLDKYGGFTDALSDFMDTLSDNATASDVLEYIDQYKEGTIDLNEAAKDLGTTAPALKKSLELLSSETMDLGLRAFKAAQEAKTFEEAVDSVKDATSTGWMNTFELMFGDYLQAKGLWTELANDLYDIFAEGGNVRNALIKEAFDKQSNINAEDWARLDEAGVTSDAFISAVRRNARQHGVYVDMMATDQEWLQTVMERGLVTVEDVTNAFDSVFKTTDVDQGLKDTVSGLKDTDEGFAALLETVEQFSGKDVGDIVFGDNQYQNRELESALDSMIDKLGLTQEEGDKLVTVLKSLGYFGGLTAEELGDISDKKEAVESIVNAHPSGQQLWTETLYNGLNTLMGMINLVRDSWADVFPPATGDTVYNIIKALHDGSASVLNFVTTSKELKSVLHGVFSAFDILLQVAGALGKIALNVLGSAFGGLGNTLLKVAASAGDAVMAFRQWLKENQVVAKAVNVVSSAAIKCITAIQGLFNSFMKLPIIDNLVRRFGSGFKMLGATLPNFIEHMSSRFEVFKKRVEGLGGIKLKNLGEIAKAFKVTILDELGKFKGFNGLKNAFSGLATDAGKAFGSIKETVSEKLANLGPTFTLFKEQMKLVFANLGIDKAVSDTFEKVKSAVTSALSAVGIDTAKLSATFDKVKNKILKLAATIKGKFVASVKNIPDSLKGIFDVFNFGSSELSDGKLSVFDRIKDAAEKAQKASEGFDVSKIGDGILNFISNLRSLASAGLEKIGSSISSFFSSLINSIDIDKIASFAKAVAGFAITITALVAAIKIAGAISDYFNSKNDNGPDFKILQYAILIGALAGSLYALSQINTTTLWSCVGAIAAIAAVLAILSFAFAKIGDTSNIAQASIGLLAMSAAVGILVYSLYKLNELDDTKLARNIGILAGIVIALGTLGVVLNRFGGFSTLTSGVGILATVAAVYMVIDLLKKLEELQITDVVNVAKNLGICIIAVGAFLFATRAAGANALGAAAAIAAIGVAVLLISTSLKILETIDVNNIKKIEKLMLAISLMLGGLMLVSGLAKGSAAAIIALAVTIALIGATLAGLSLMDPSALRKASETIQGVIGFLALLMGVMGLLKPSALAVAALAVLMLSIAAVFYIMHDIPADQLTVITDSLCKAMTSLTILMAVLGVIGMLGPASLIGVGAALALVIGIGLIIAKMGDMVGKGISDFTGYLPKISEDLAAFAEGIKPFAEISRGISEGDFSGIKALTSCIGDIAGGEFKMFLSSLFGGDPIMRFVNQLPELARGLNAYAEALDPNMDQGKVTAAATATQLLAATASHDIPEGGIIGWLKGNGSRVSDFSTQLVQLAEGLNSYATTINSTTFNEEKIEASKNLATMLSDLANNTIPEGGVIGWLKGNSSKIEDFGSQLPALAFGLSAYAMSINATTFNDEKLEASKKLTEMLSDLTNESIPDGGLMNWIRGNNTKIKAFATQLPALAAGLSAYALAIDETTFNDEKLTASQHLASMLASLAANEIPDGGLFGMLTGNDTKIVDFAVQLPALAVALKAYADKVDETTFNDEKITASENLAKMLASLANDSIKASGGLFSVITGEDTKIIDFAVQLPALAYALSQYATEIDATTFSDDKLNASIRLAAMLSTLSNDSIKASGGLIGTLTGENTKILDFANQLPTLAGALSLYANAIDATTFNADKLTASVMLAAMLSTLSNDSIKASGGLIGMLTGKNSKIIDFANQLPTLAGALSLYANAIDATTFNADKLTASGNLISMLSTLASEKIEASGGLIGMLTGKNSKIIDFANQLPTLAEKLTAYADALGDSLLGEKVEAATNAATLLAELGSALTGQNLGGWLSDSDITKFGGSIEDFGTSLGTFSETKVDIPNLNRLLSASSISQSIATLINDVTLDGDIMSDTLVDTFVNNLDRITAAMSGIDDVDGEKLASIASSFSTISSLNTSDLSESTNINGAIEGMASAASKTSSDAGKGIGESLASGISGSASAVSGALSAVADSAANNLNTSQFSGKGSEIIMNIVSGISGSSWMITGALNTAMSTAKNSVSTSSFHDLGMNAAEGFAQGIRDGIPRIKAASIDAARAANDAWAATIESHSPSRVTMRYGAYYVEGFVIGLHQHAKEAANATRNLGETANAGMLAAVKGIREVLNSEMDYEPTVRPVLDLSEIQNGARSIAGMLNVNPSVPVMANVGAIDSSTTRSTGTGNEDLIAAINDLKASMTTSNTTGNTYIVDGITYDDGSNIVDAVRSLVHASNVGRRA